MSALLRGRPEKPVGFTREDVMVRMVGCPDCRGRGWFLINPFAFGNTDGSGGIKNKCQCQTCASSKAYWDEHGTVPPEVADAVEKAMTHRDA